MTTTLKSLLYSLLAGCLLTLALTFTACHAETFDAENPDVDLFVDQLRSGKYHPLATASYSAAGRLRLGECILWTVETIRLGHNASMGCKMVHIDADNYEGIYFLSDEEVLDAAARYRRWWESRKYPRTMWTVDPCYDEPLCGSGYMWW